MGNLPAMNQWRMAGLLIVAILAAWLLLRSCTPRESPPVMSPPAARDQFHASKPLRVVVLAASDPDPALADLTWLARELRYVLIRGRMRIAPIEPATSATYTLQVAMPRTLPGAATLQLLAPNGTVEREQQLEIPAGQLHSASALAAELPGFIGAAHSSDDWSAYLGTQDEEAYAAFIRSAEELWGPAGVGFTRPNAAKSSATIERLETLTRRHPRFLRAFATLSLAYLSLGGKDEASLTQLAESTAEHALGQDSSFSDAQSALGIVRVRRGEWVAATEHFNTALAADSNAAAALEGLACLMVDVGHLAAALPLAQRAVMLQPGSIGASECLNYAQLATDGKSTSLTPVHGSQALAAAQVLAVDAILAGDTVKARELLKNSTDSGAAQPWIEPLLRAAADKRRTSQALQAITRAASDGGIDPVTEVACGAALRQTDFVFNRMLRLHKQKQAVPLRVLWLPGTRFLRQHARFEDVVSAEGLLPFWQDHGLPDVCKAEPDIYGCKIRAGTSSN